MKYNLLNRLELPGGVKRLNPEQQKILCWEIRQKLLHTLSENGGHLASNLGVVELTVALHTVFDVPQDAIVWDVGHQCYAHKMLTGRLGAFPTILRGRGGSPASRARARAAVTPLSRGTRAPRSPPPAGSRRPRRSAGDRHHVVAVVGDGAFTGGMIYEALNNAGRTGNRLIVVLNDNDMSISKSVGSLRALSRLQAHERGVLKC